MERKNYYRLENMLEKLDETTVIDYEAMLEWAMRFMTDEQIGEFANEVEEYFEDFLEETA